MTLVHVGGAAAQALASARMMQLSDDLLRMCLQIVCSFKGRRERASATSVCSRWRTLMHEVVDRELRDRGSHVSVFNPLLQLASLEQLERQVGVRPARSWQTELAKLMVAAIREQWRLGRAYVDFDEWTDEIEEGYHEGFSDAGFLPEKLQDEERAIASTVRSGIPLEVAQAFHVLSTNASESVFQEGREFAASAYAVYDGLSWMARLQDASHIAPLAYAGLSGAYGLDEDESWNVLKTAVVGQRWRIARVGVFSTACEEAFPDGRDDGFYSSDLDVDETFRSMCQSRDVVCVRSARNDRSGRRSMIKELGNFNSRRDGQCYVLPPAAVVTLTSVQHVWRVLRQTMRCRLFTCEVVFDL